MTIQDCDELHLKRRVLSVWRHRCDRKRRFSITQKLRKMTKRNRHQVLRGLILRFKFRQMRISFALLSKHCRESRWTSKFEQEKLQRQLRALASVVVRMVQRWQRVAFMRLGRIVREGRHLTQLRQVATSLQLQVSGGGCGCGSVCIAVVVVCVCVCMYARR